MFGDGHGGPGVNCWIGAGIGSRARTLLWISSVDLNSQFCTGVLPYHGTDQAMDLFADPDGTMCSSAPGSAQIPINMRTWGFAQTTHSSLTAFMYAGEYPGGCNYIEARTVENGSGLLRGTERYIHAGNLIGSAYGIWVAAWPGYTLGPQIGSTVWDGNCSGGWTGMQVHQGFVSACGSKGGLQPTTIYQTWNAYTLVNRFAYTEWASC
ncbi:MAG: hypothetical protein KGK07_10105 [Chloroflexota bacterium]|nr:hypothetical protein [Chloroflexota bacterium]